MNEKVWAKKSLGQHWLHDELTLEAMAMGVDASAGDAVLEVGPGLGTLTKQLVDRGCNVIAVEFDEKLARELPRRVPADTLQVINQDILSFDLSQLPQGYKVAANIPYYLTSKLLRMLCESPTHFSKATLLIQKEVAERVCAGPGDMSLLSVSVQFYCRANLGDFVPKELFTPPPKVDSQILLLEYRDKPLFDVDEKAFFRLVKAGFHERRKKLRSSLSGGLRISKPEAEELLAKAGIDPSLRPQHLTLENWYSLYAAHHTNPA